MAVHSSKDGQFLMKNLKKLVMMFAISGEYKHKQKCENL